MPYHSRPTRISDPRASLRARTRRRAAALALLLLPCALAACGRGTAATVDADALPRLTLEAELRIGDVDDPEVGFSRIAGLSVASDGRMFVLEGQDRQVRVYAADGTPLRRIGGPGQGPGEFVSVNASGLIGDTLWVSDVQGRRITLFTADGEVLSIVPAQRVEYTPVPNVMVQVYPLRVESDGTLSSTAVINMLGSAPEATFRIPRLRFDRSGAVLDTVGYTVVEPPPRVRVADREITVSSPLGEEPLRVTVAGDSVIVERPAASSGAPASFTVTRVGPAGDTVFRRTLGYTPVPLQPAVRDSLVRGRIAIPIRLGFPGDTAELRRTVEAAMELPPFHPPVSQLFVGEDASLWIRREDEGATWRWIALAADGEPLGQLTLPRSATLRWADGERLWTSEQDELGVPWLVRYRIAGR